MQAGRALVVELLCFIYSPAAGYLIKGVRGRLVSQTGSVKLQTSFSRYSELNALLRSKLVMDSFESLGILSRRFNLEGTQRNASFINRWGRFRKGDGATTKRAPRIVAKSSKMIDQKF